MRPALLLLLILSLTGSLSSASSPPVYSFSNRDPATSEEFTLLSAPKHSVILRAPRSIGNFFRRFLGRGSSSSSGSPGGSDKALQQQELLQQQYPSLAVSGSSVAVARH